MQFVVDVLESLFQKSPAEACRVMMSLRPWSPAERIPEDWQWVSG